MKSNYIIIAVFLLIASCASDYIPGFDYKSILVKSNTYEKNSKQNYIDFTYQQSSDANLIKLSQTYDLQTIAGTGATIERATKLAQWLQNITEQDGSEKIRTPKNAIDLLNKAIQGQVRLNCSATSICFTESLLAIGISARTLSMYAFTPSTELHVVSIFWSPELKKWIYFDPSYNTMLYGDPALDLPLSPLEIREKLQKGEPLYFSKKAGWNGGDFDLDYRNYLEKNIYYFYSPLNSEFGGENNPKNIRIHLTPIGTNPELNIFSKNILVHDPSEFFAAPH